MMYARRVKRDANSLDLMRLEFGLTRDELIAHVDAGIVGVVDVDDIGWDRVDDLPENTVTA